MLREQVYGGTAGVRLATPLVLGDGRAVLVVRGWVPYGEDTPEHWPELEEPAGAPVIGLIQESQLLPNGAAPSVPRYATAREWFYLNIDAIQPQMPYKLLPVFILMLPEADRAYDKFPIRDEPITLSEGNHFELCRTVVHVCRNIGSRLYFPRALSGDAARTLAREAESPLPTLETTG